uniref:hypothetical protein n=1 Tax=Variovorax sp. BK018 TaxID=3450241 RepID=UPI00403A107A
MQTITRMFQPYLSALFDREAVFEDDGKGTLRVTQKLSGAAEKDARRYARYVALHIEPAVIAEYSQAVTTGDAIRRAQIGANVREISIARLQDYDPDGPEDSAFVIEIDGRALDR